MNQIGFRKPVVDFPQTHRKPNFSIIRPTRYCRIIYFFHAVRVISMCFRKPTANPPQTHRKRSMNPLSPRDILYISLRGGFRGVARGRAKA